MALRQVDVVRRNALRLRELVSDLLHTAQAREGRVELERQEVDVCDLVRDAVEAALPAAEAAGVRVVSEAPGSLVARLDPRRIRQVLDNLLSNAIKYSDPGSEACVRLTRVGARLDIAVADTGIGIAADEVQQLFSRFFRGSQARARLAPGTGLGLSIVRAIAEAHGGEVRVSSEPGRGSTFTLSVPYVDPVR